ncbi:hypothetical protein [Nocardia sp. NPDC057440]
MRKWLAGRLIRLAHRIYPPRVTDYSTKSVNAELLDCYLADRRESPEWN